MHFTGCFLACGGRGGVLVRPGGQVNSSLAKRFAWGTGSKVGLGDWELEETLYGALS